MKDNIEKKIENLNLNEDPKFKKNLENLKKTRANNVTRIIALKNENRDIKLNKQIDKLTKQKLILQNKRTIKEIKEKMAVDKVAQNEFLDSKKDEIAKATEVYKTAEAKTTSEYKQKLANLDKKDKKAYFSIKREMADALRTLKHERDAIYLESCKLNDTAMTKYLLKEVVEDAKLQGSENYYNISLEERNNCKKGKEVYNENLNKEKERYNKSLALIKQSKIKISDDANRKISEIKISESKEIENEKALYSSNFSKLTGKEREVEKDRHEASIADIKSKFGSQIETYKSKIKDADVNVKAETILHKSNIENIDSTFRNIKENAKRNKYNAYLDEYSYIEKARNNVHSLVEKLQYKASTYQYNFVLKDFLLRNALYFIIIIFFIICIIASNGNLLSLPNINGILSQSSTKVFFSLGVAGLILIAGTDLSIGRMTGMAGSISCMLLAATSYSTNQGLLIDVTGLSWGVRIFLAIFVSILLCVLFSAIAGFFAAKFKMHPFITTLSTQLIMFGTLMVLFSSVPAFNMDLSIKKAITGTSNINIIIFAIVAIVVMYFIWNRTKFGKYMYAVGGNPEAASVSGISVFAVTMGIFVMAGVLYGIGGFLEGARVGVANPNTGYGTELDAIAACVVGGISFSGGVGKIRGAVIGTIIFTGLTYCLTYLGFDINIQYIFKGVIIMTAVCLDSLKYLKKK